VLPVIPSFGLHSGLIEDLRKELKVTETHESREIHFVWTDLPGDTLVEIDQVNDRLLLNEIYRKKLLSGSRRTDTDLPVLKCLLFMLLEDVLKSERIGTKLRSHIARVNRIAIMALHYEPPLK
jgi:hypothetical protein